MVKVAINGFGRIGRLALRKLMEQTDKFEVDHTYSHLARMVIASPQLRHDNVTDNSYP